MPHLTLFLLAALALAITPGPGMFYVVGRTWAAGRADGLASSFGTMLGGFVHVVACVVGVSALIMASATAFTVLKLCGGVYLIWLGIQTWRSASQHNMEVPREGRTGVMQAFRQGVVVEATNPKTAAFFLAFIPQFIVPATGHVALQFLMLGVISVLLNTGADLLAVLCAHRLHERFLHRPSLFRRLRQGSGALMASLGIGLLLSRRPV
jgi:threonine/homoserine/homoserine lactone efflux protein